MVGADVECLQRHEDSWLRKSSRTGPEGLFRVEGLFDCEAKITVDSSVGAQNEEKLRAWPGGSEVKIVLDRYASVKGSVVDATGHPADAFSVYTKTRATTSPPVDKQGFLSKYDDLLEETRLFTGGEFELKKEVAPGIVVVVVETTEGEKVVSEPFRVEPGGEKSGIEITLPGARIALRGKVLDGVTRKPVPGATVYADFLISFDTMSFSEPDHRTTTDENGEFFFTRLSEDKIEVAADHPDYSPAKIPRIELKSGRASEEVVIHLEKGGAVEGRVLTQGTDPANIVVEAKSFESGAAGTSKTDKNGFYRIENLSPGKCDISARCIERGSQAVILSRKVMVESGKTIQCDLVPGGSIIEGTVTAGGEPQGGIHISLRPENILEDDAGGTRSFFVFGRTQSDGSYKIEGLYPGEYRIEVGVQSLDFDYEPKEGEVELRITKIVTIEPGVNHMDFTSGEAGLGEIQGHFFENGTPREGMWVHLSGGWPSPFMIKTRTDSEGFYKFSNVPAGMVSLETSPKEWTNYGHPYVAMSITLKAGETVVQDLHLRFGTGVIAGNVIRDGKPVEWWDAVEVSRVPGPGETVTGIRCQLRRSGFRAEGLLPGRYDVVISKPRYMKKSVDVAGNQEVRVDFDLSEATCVLQGRVICPDLENFVVFLFAPDTFSWKEGQDVAGTVAPEGMITYGTAPSEDEGRFTIEDLMPGKYELIAIRFDKGKIITIIKESVSLNTGETMTLELNANNQ